MPESKGPEGADRPMAMESIFTLMRHPLRENEGAPHKPVLLVWEYTIPLNENRVKWAPGRYDSGHS